MRDERIAKLTADPVVEEDEALDDDLARRPLDQPLIRRLLILKLWQAGDTFDPARLMQKFSVSIRTDRPVVPIGAITTRPDHTPAFVLQPRGHH